MSSDRPVQVIVYLDAIDLGPRRAVGVLRMAGRGEGSIFTYARSWLDWTGSFPLGPSLPLDEADRFVERLPGAIADAAPDRWGRRLLDRREAIIAAQQGRRRRTLRDWDYLLGVADRGRMGALRLATAPGAQHFLSDAPGAVPPLADLRRLEHAAGAVERGADPSDDELRLLVDPGSSLGGARPKATYAGSDGTMWIAKFPSGNDVREVGAWEHLLVSLAQRAGIQVPDHRLHRLGVNGRTFATRRFDRSGERRHLVVSGMTLARRADGEDASYLEIAQAIADHGDPSEIDADLQQLFRRVAFNVMVANRDDHLRNHAFIRRRGGWRLAPAYDINPAPEKVGHALAIDDANRDPSIDLVRSTAAFYRLRVARADAIIHEVASAIADWQRHARALDLPADEIGLVATAVRSR